MPDRARRWRPTNLKPAPSQAPKLRVTNALGTDGGTAAIYLYDAIDCYGGEWGVSAAELVAALNSVQASQLDLHINSPGGDYREAIAMRAALLQHPAQVHVYVDGLAASAASVLATIGDKVTMAPGSQIMVHKASTLEIGNADEMRKTADDLDKIDARIAQFYADRSGGTAESWLAAMAVETWLDENEAVAAGLADEVAPEPIRDRPDALPVAASADHWILATYRYAGRDKAPAPVTSRIVGEHGPELVDLPAGAVAAGEPPATPEQEPIAAAADQPAPLTAPLLDDDAIARIAEAVAERLAPQTTPEAPAPEASGGNVVALPVEAPTSETSAAETAAALPPAALPTAGPPTPLPAAWDPHLIRNAIRKAAAS